MLRFSQAFARKTAISLCERRASRGGWLQPIDLVAFTIGPSGRLGLRDRQSLPPARQFLPPAAPVRRVFTQLSP
jgi:hypothetical protein